VAESVQKGTRVIVTGRLDQRSWETQDGEKRSKIEIVADEVGPSVRYATAAVTKNERRGADLDGGGAGARPAANEPPAGYGADEEPF
jgi:single-strand DNA-binding protein